jgi:tetratricopeptide (TPR) repeat protein
MVSLADWYADQGKYTRAESLLTAALEGLRRVQGEEHPDTLRAMCHLGWLFFGQGKWPEAELQFVTALSLDRKVLGEDHYETLKTMGHLGLLYLWEGRFAQSEELYTKALELADRVRGEDHCTLAFMGNLAFLYGQQGMYGRADELSAKALEGFRRVRGAEHIETWASMIVRASSLSKMGKTAPAEVLLTKALEDLRRIDGEGSGKYWTMDTLGETYEAQGRLAEAQTQFTQALEGYRRVFGDNHFWTLATMTHLAELFLNEGRLEKAEPLLIEGQKLGVNLGDEGTLIAETAAALARLRLAQRRPAEAEPPARRALAIRLDRHPDHWTRFDALSLLGAALVGQKKYTEAEPLLLLAYEGLKDREERIPFLWRKKRPAEAGARIVALYDGWGKKDKVDAWRKRLNEEKAGPPRTPGTRP